MTNNHHVLLSEERGLILFLTPKCGNSSIKDLILKGCDTPGLGYEFEASFRFICPDDMKEEYQSYRSIVIGRDPIQRVISCWRDKIMSAEKGTRLADWGYDFFPKMEFSDFIRSCKLAYDLHGGRYVEKHARPISCELSLFGVKNPEKFKLEDLKDDIRPLALMLRDHGVYIQSQLPKLNASTPHEAQFDVDTLGIISYLYSNDFDLFDYTRPEGVPLQGE